MEYLKSAQRHWKITRWLLRWHNRGFRISKMQISLRMWEKRFPRNFKDICAFFFFEAAHLTPKLHRDASNIGFSIAYSTSALPNLLSRLSDLPQWKFIYSIVIKHRETLGFFYFLGHSPRTVRRPACNHRVCYYLYLQAVIITEERD